MKLFNFGARVLNADLIVGFRFKEHAEDLSIVTLFAEMENGNSFSLNFEGLNAAEVGLITIAVDLADFEINKEVISARSVFMNLFQKTFGWNRDVNIDLWDSLMPIY